jgi:NAD(P)-dependent dehydrogenase (short-subunit alcohol dehydrogenase family)
MTDIKTIAIVGGGELAQAFVKNYQGQFSIDVVGHEQFDIGDQTSCDQFIPKLANYDAVIITAAINNDNLWKMWQVNAVGPCYLVAGLNALANNQRIVVVSSHGASWFSWPEIPSARLNYNATKLALNNFLSGLIQQGGTTNKITVFEPARFKTHLSNYQGAEVDVVANQLYNVLTNPMHVTHMVVKDL